MGTPKRVPTLLTARPLVLGTPKRVPTLLTEAKSLPIEQLALKRREETLAHRQAEARMEVFDFIEGWYNPHRRHSGLAHSSPMEYERQ